MKGARLTMELLSSLYNSSLYNISNTNRTRGRVVPAIIPGDHHLVPSLLHSYSSSLEKLAACFLVNPNCSFVFPDIDNNRNGPLGRFYSLPFFWSYPTNRVAITTTGLNSISTKCKHGLGTSNPFLALLHKAFICEVLGLDPSDLCAHNRGF
jgi:hypothetical protein